MQTKYDRFRRPNAEMLLYGFLDGSYCCGCFDGSLEIRMGPIYEFHAERYVFLFAGGIGVGVVPRHPMWEEGDKGESGALFTLGLESVVASK